MGWDGILGAGSRKPNTKTIQPPVRQPAALQRNDATAVSSPPAASPQVKHAPAAGGGDLQRSEVRGQKSEDSIVRTAPEKYGRAIAPEVPALKTHDVVLGGPGEIVVKSHLRNAPAVPKEEPEPTADLIVEECGKRIRRSTRDSLYIGSLVYRFILKQPERAPDAQFGRKGALEHLRGKLLAARLDEGSCRVDRDLRCYHLVHACGGDSKGLNISVIRLMLPLLAKEEGKERPSLKEPTAEAAKILWIRAVNERLTAAAVRIEVLRILLPAKLPRGDRGQRSRQAATILRLLPTVSIEELAEVIRAARDLRVKAKSDPPAAIAG